ncbi:hypothetical protein DID88_008103 [Monilinia fructigena]|uniref:C2H2-type domain-containing protein n=1 Tax=Monilinia fructigena TaxID=38457 RepID=A0A395J5E2_9HELO|nr:hypothetical protein DID88_008103 [Monilinia fructigena]
MAKDPKDTHAKKPNSQSDDNQPKRRGRPPKQPSPEVEIQAPNPMYLIYKCEWKNCPAQLHNLATLRLHLLKNHRKKENAMYSLPELGIVTQHKFKDENEWKSHVEKKHLTPYAWHMGDGPQNSLVTPSVGNQQLEGGDPRENNARRFKRRLSGLDYVLDPIYDYEPKSSTQARESNVQENNEAHSGTENEDEDDDNVDMNSGSSI